MTRPDPTDTAENGDQSVVSSFEDAANLADRLAVVEAGADERMQPESRALRVELEDQVRRSRRDPASLAAERWSRRLADAVHRADRAENRLARLEQRRWFRLAQTAVLALRHPPRLPKLFPQIVDSFRKHPLPRQLERPAIRLPAPRPSATSQRPGPYAHLKIAHAGRLRVFDGLARYIDITAGPAVIPGTFDFLLLEPGFDETLADVRLELLDEFAEARIPTLLFARTARHLQLPHANRVSVIVTDTPNVAREAPGETLVLDPSVDPRLHNPVGWERDPTGHVLDLDQEPGLWGESLAERIKAHRIAATTRPDLALVAAAAGTPVVAPSAPTLDRLLGDRYLSCESPEQIRRAAERMSNSESRERLSVATRRHVLTHHTHRARLEEILDRLSIPRVAPPSISVLLATRRPERLEEAIASVTRQDWPTVEPILMLHDPDSFDRKTVEKLASRARVVKCRPSWTLGDCLNAGLERVSGEYVAKMDDDDHYGEMHLRDLITGLEYAEAAAVGKLSNITYLTSRDVTLDWRIHDQERFVHHLPGATLMMRREIALQYRFDRVQHGVDTALWNRMRADGLALYSTHRMNFVRVRHDDHTYTRGDDDFLNLATTVPERGLDLQRWFA